MEISALDIEGAWEVVPKVWPDDRGAFLEWYRHDRLTEAVGHPLGLAQANTSVSRRGVLRGIHFATVPPGQAKYVTAMHGAVVDYIVDVRVGSPTFGRWCAVRLDDVDRRAVYLEEGLGHAFVAVSDVAIVSYLVTSTYAPDREFGVHPLDPTIGLELPDGIEPLLSPKDAGSPGLDEARQAGLLPTYSAARAYATSLDRREG